MTFLQIGLEAEYEKKDTSRLAACFCYDRCGHYTHFSMDGQFEFI